MPGHGHFHWNELMTWDAAAAKAFYSATLGWHIEEMPMEHGGTYHVAMVDGQPVAGIFQLEKGVGMDEAQSHWFAYLEVDDLDKRLDALKENGGSVVREPFFVPEVGHIALITDPTGAEMGWMVPAN